MHIHLDVIGGISGDMFCAAMLDVFPELEQPLMSFLACLPLTKSYAISIEPAKQKSLVGRRFNVLKNQQPIADHTHQLLDHQAEHTHTHSHHHAPLHHHKHQHEHHHYDWENIQGRLKQIEQEPAIYQCALAIYSLLIEAEAHVHGLALSQISLHEVGADDALIDIISAAFLIDRSGVKTCSTTSLPWGNGTVKCAHGEIPVPAPATLEILKEFEWHHDTEVGERVTPTGAAILSWLMRHHKGNISGTLSATGYGFGHRELKTKANALRLSAFNTEANHLAYLTHEKNSHLIQCDIDDMSPELLAIAQKHLNDVLGVIEITSQVRMGKKGRWVTQLDILCNQANLDQVCESILLETSTLGVRFWPIERYTLSRQHLKQNYREQDWAVKSAQRPNNQVTAKLEADTLQNVKTHAERQGLKNTIENLALEKNKAYPKKGDPHE